LTTGRGQFSLRLIAAALGSHGQLPYQILTKSDRSPPYTQDFQLHDPPVPTAGGRVSRFSASIGDAPLTPICVLLGRATG